MIETKVLEGEKVRLRPGEERDLPLFVRWFDDPEVRHWLHLSELPEPTLDSEWESYERRREESDLVGWTIETVRGRPIGRIGLLRIEGVHGRAELGVSIGDKGYWGQGYGTEAIQLALRHAFEELGLRRVTLITDSDNERGLRCYEKCGFVREGLLHGHRLRYGRPLDMVVMGVLREEWNGGRR